MIVTRLERHAYIIAMSNALARWRARRPALTRRSRFARLFTGAAVLLSLVLSASFLAADPALAADIGSSGLPYATGHTCVNVPDTGPDGMCIDLAVYWSASGQASAVAQVEAWCTPLNYSPAYQQCDKIDVYASAENPTTAKAGTASEGTCGSGACEKTTRTFIYPLGGIHIAANSCADNVWATVFEDWQNPSNDITYWSAIYDPDFSGALTLSANLSTPHYNICLLGTSATFSPVS